MAIWVDGFLKGMEVPIEFPHVVRDVRVGAVVIVTRVFLVHLPIAWLEVIFATTIY